MFYEEFRAHFTEQEWNTQIVKILTQIGINVERTILEEFNRQIRMATEFIAFDDNRIRSWLSFLLEPVRNVISANGTVTLTIDESTGSVPIEAGWQIQAGNGAIYRNMTTALLPMKGKITLSVIQGNIATFRGTYADIIAIPRAGIDFTTLFTVIVGGIEILPVKQIQNHLKPVDGYFAYYHNNTLYIKIYKGTSIREETEHTTIDPEGKAFEITYMISEGARGNVPQDSFQSFSHQLIDTNRQIVQYHFENAPIANGNDPPTHWELVNQLRAHFLTGSNVASITEYEIWFNSQPEVGDCIVTGDYEKWLYEGGELISTGRVSVMLMDKQGNPIPSIIDGGTQPVPNSTLDIINKRLAEVRDIAAIDYSDFTEVQHFYVVQFASVSNVTEFEVFAKNIFSNFYDLNWARNNGISLFQPLDLLQLVNQLSGNYALTGARVIPYHYLEVNIGESGFIHAYVYAGEMPGGFYRYYETNEEGERVLAASLAEYEQADGSGLIYLIDPVNNLPIGDYVGTRFQDQIDIRLNGNNDLNIYAKAGGVMECYFLVRDQGVMPVGVPNGVRVLKDVEFEQVG